MERLIGGVASAAAALAAIALLTGAVPVADLTTIVRAAADGMARLDPISFGVGAVASLIGVRIGSIPWSERWQQLCNAILGLGRTAILASIAMIAAGIVLLY
jgi:hypothetical protein